MTGQFIGCHAFSRDTGLSETRIAQGFRCYFRCPSLFRGEASKMQTSERPAAYLLHRVTPDTLKMLLIYRARSPPRLLGVALMLIISSPQLGKPRQGCGGHDAMRMVASVIAILAAKKKLSWRFSEIFSRRSAAALPGSALPVDIASEIRSLGLDGCTSGGLAVDSFGTGFASGLNPPSPERNQATQTAD